MRKALRVSKWACFSFAVMIALYMLLLWIKDPHLSYMELLIQYWYWYATVFGAIVLGNIFNVIEPS